MKKIKSLVYLLVVSMLVSIFAAGCSSDNSSNSDTVNGEAIKAEEDAPKELDKVTLQLKWLPQSQFMGYYVAKEKGYYEEEGIDLEILPGGSDIIPEQQVYNGVADIGITWVSSLLKYQSEGWELIHAGQVFQKSAMLLVSKASAGINSAEDLKGKKVGSWFGGNEYEIYALLEANGIDRDNDLELVQQDFTMNQLLNDDIDAASAMTYNEYGLLLESGLKDSELSTLDMNDAGVAMLEDCLFVNSEWIAENEELYVRFLKATIKGWAEACADPEAAGQIVFDADQSVSLEHQTYMAKEIAKLVVPEGFDSANIGYTDMDAFQQTADLAYKYGLLSEEYVISEDKVTSQYWEEAIK
jgi:NitT/TauT family transport system substrate-binding protein